MYIEGGSEGDWSYTKDKCVVEIVLILISEKLKGKDEKCGADINLVC